MPSGRPAFAEPRRYWTYDNAMRRKNPLAMRILCLTHAFNSLSQRLFCELTARGHEISIEFDIADPVAEEAVALFRPDLVLAPFLKRAIPESIWSRHVCLVVHPGIVGDKGPSALDWAIQEGEARWGVTVLQAEAEMDAGPVWAFAEFPLRRGKKASIYRNEVTEAAVRAVLEAVSRVEAGDFAPQRPGPQARGQLRPLMKQATRRIDWQRDTTAAVQARLNAADGFPGVADELFGEPCHLFDAWPEAGLAGAPGELLARRETAICRATADGAVWIGHVKRRGGIKLPATLAFPEAAALPESRLEGWWKTAAPTWQDIAYEEAGEVGFLSFEFYNGAMSTDQCRRLTEAFRWAVGRPTRVIVLLGGEDFWSNGVHLNVFEAADEAGSTPADESWANINAIDDLAEAIITTGSHLTVAAVQGNTGAGGCFLARAADFVWMRDGALMNPHYKNMGNLYGSEYWTYLLPRRLGEAGARELMAGRLPLRAADALRIGLIDACDEGPREGYENRAIQRALALAGSYNHREQVAAKQARRAADEVHCPLARYREQELARMHRNFYGFDPSYHVARHHFVHKLPHAWTPRHLATHR